MASRLEERTAAPEERVAPPSPVGGRARPRFPAAWASIVVGVLLWELAVVLFQPSRLVIVAPSEIGRRFVVMAADGTLWPDLSISLAAFAIGYLVAAVVAIPLGLIIGSSVRGQIWGRPWISGLYATPLIGLAPLFVVIFGYGLAAKVAVAICLAVFPILINTIAGTRAVGKDFTELASVFGAGRIETLGRILLPGSAPFILTGLRLAVGPGLIGVVVADLFGATAGLGLSLQRSANEFDTASIYAVTVLLAVIGIALTSAIELAERRAYRRSGVSA